MNTYLFELHKDKPIGFAEVKSVILNIDETAEFNDKDNFLLIKTKIILPDLTKKLAYTHKIYEFICNFDNESLKNADWKKYYTENFAIRTINKDIIDKVSKAIWKSVDNPKVKLDDSKTEIYVFFDKVFILRQKISTEALKRKNQNRPIKNPVSLSPLLAMAMVNLTKGNTLYDPFCGTGGILIEAAILGKKIIGSDISYQMVKGSEINNEYISFLENYSVFDRKFAEINNQMQTAILTENHSMLEESKKIYSATEIEMNAFIKRYISEHPDSYLSLFLLNNNLIDLLDISETEKLKNNFSDSIKKSEIFTELNDKIKIRKKFQYGNQAPDFSMTDSVGKIYSLSAFQGSYLLLYFGASWNKDCAKDIEIINKNNKLLKQKSVNVFQVFFENNPEEWKEFLKKTETNRVCVSDFEGIESEVIKLYNIRKLPIVFFLDKKGTIVQSYFEIEELSEILHSI